MKIALGIEYDGSGFHGWQKQIGLSTVQQQVELALSTVAAHPIIVYCAGRTDTGVHAIGQVVHFETTSNRSERAWVLGTNANLPNTITIRWARIVPDDFHARFCALSRTYRYVIYNNPLRPAIGRHNVTWHYRYLDHLRMDEAAQYLRGEHDFTSYRALSCQAKTAIRTISKISVTRKDELVIIDVIANAFLHHMIRNIVGVLISVGAGSQEPIWTQEVLQAKDRTLGGVTAPPYGLCFIAANYHDDYKIPTQLPSSYLIG